MNELQTCTAKYIIYNKNRTNLKKKYSRRICFNEAQTIHVQASCKMLSCNGAINLQTSKYIKKKNATKI